LKVGNTVGQEKTFAGWGGEKKRAGGDCKEAKKGNHRVATRKFMGGAPWKSTLH